MKKILLSLLAVTTLVLSSTAFASQNTHQTSTQTQLGTDCSGGC